MAMQELPKDRIVDCVEQIKQDISKLPATECLDVLGELAKLTEHARMRMTGPHAQTEEPEEQLLNIEGIAKYLQVPVHTARQLAKTKDFPALQFGKRVLVVKNPNRALLSHVHAGDVSAGRDGDCLFHREDGLVEATWRSGQRHKISD